MLDFLFLLFIYVITLLYLLAKVFFIPPDSSPFSFSFSTSFAILSCTFFLVPMSLFHE